MIAPARAEAYRALQAVCVGRTHSDDAVHTDRISRLDPRDRSLVMELVYGTLRWQARLDWYLAPLVERRWSMVHPQLQILLRMSLYQFWRLTRVPPPAAVHDAVEIARAARLSSSAGFVNAVLRQALRMRPWESSAALPPWIEFSLPRWLWVRWAERFGEDRAGRFAATLNEPAPLAYRGNTAAGRASRASSVVPGAWLVERSARETLDAASEPVRYQDEASQLIPFLLGPLTGGRVWDACAAPGGKASILRELVGEQGRVLSTDLDLRRLARLRSLPAGSSEAEDNWLVCADAGKEAPFRCRFDAVLVDAPCSGLGTLRRNPEIRWRCTPDRLKELADSQSRILAAASASVQPRGLLLYATCSTEPEENDEVVERFLATHPGFRLLRPTHPGSVNEWTDSRGYLRTFPSDRLWDGFFAALMLRD